MSFKAKDGIDVNAGKFKVTKDGDVTARKINDIVNVKAFGAKGDSVTDDSDAISLAADFCLQNGGVLFFPRGDYYSPTFTVPDVIAQMSESGDFIQSNRSSFKFGTRKPNKPKPGTVYWDAQAITLMLYNGTEWISFLRKNGSDSIKGDLTVEGNLIVQGDTVTLNTSTLEVEDNIVTLNKNVTGTPTLNAGIEVNRGNLGKAQVIFDESSDTWNVNLGDGVLREIALTKSSKDYEITDFSKGVILKSPDNSRWRITVDNTGALTSTKL